MYRIDRGRTISPCHTMHRFCGGNVWTSVAAWLGDRGFIRRIPHGDAGGDSPAELDLKLRQASSHARIRHGFAVLVSSFVQGRDDLLCGFFLVLLIAAHSKLYNSTVLYYFDFYYKNENVRTGRNREALDVVAEHMFKSAGERGGVSPLKEGQQTADSAGRNRPPTALP